MNNPKISVIVPVYNVEKYLSHCIESILAQTFTDFELLLVDDGSTDGSGKICDEYAAKDCRIRVFHKNNEGVSSARNIGIDNACGEWMCFVDSDDEIKTDHLMNFFCIASNKYMGLYVCGCQLGNKYKKFFSLPYKTYVGEEIQDFIIAAKRKIWLLGVSWNKMFRSEIINSHRLRFDISIWAYEDELFVLRYLKYCQSIMVLPYCTYVYHCENISSLSHKYLDAREHIVIAEKLFSAGLRLNFSSTKFRIFLNEEYAKHLCGIVVTLYWPLCRFNIILRHHLLKKVIKAAKEKKTEILLIKYLRMHHFYGLNVFLLEINGLLLNVYHQYFAYMRNKSQLQK